MPLQSAAAARQLRHTTDARQEPGVCHVVFRLKMAVRMPAGKEDQSCRPGAADLAVMIVLLGLLETKLD
jgi:hypothetical protein